MVYPLTKSEIGEFIFKSDLQRNLGRYSEAIEDFVRARPLTQSGWDINSVNGDDDADGATAETALKSITEFDRRIEGGVISTPFVVNAVGAFPDQSFQHNYQFVGAGSLRVIGGTIEQVDSLTLAAATATADPEVQTITVTGFDFTPHINQRGRFLDGPAVGMLFWITAVNPNGVGGTSTARISIVGEQTAAFKIFNYNYAEPQAGNTFTIETMTPLGAIDVKSLGGHKASNVGLTRRIQYEQFELLDDINQSRIAVDDKDGAVIYSCRTNCALQGPGILSMDFCNHSGATSDYGGLNVIFDSGLISATFRANLIAGFFSRSMVYQGAQAVCRARSSFEQYNAFFDTDIGIAGFSSVHTQKGGDMFGSNISDVLVALEAGSTMIADTDPTVVGTNGAVRLAGVNQATYAAAIAASPLGGAGYYPKV